MHESRMVDVYPAPVPPPAPVKARGLLFRADMARAVIEGRKTVTRRVGATWARVKVGDHLWGREAWRAPACCDALSPTQIGEKALEAGYPSPRGPLWYSDETFNGWCTPSEALRDWGGVGRLRPSLHMPRWACRIELEVVSVRVESPPVVLLVDDAEALREGFANAVAFLAAWTSMHPNYFGPIYRIEFSRVTA